MWPVLSFPGEMLRDRILDRISGSGLFSWRLQNEKDKLQRPRSNHRH